MEEKDTRTKIIAEMLNGIKVSLKYIKNLIHETQ